MALTDQDRDTIRLEVRAGVSEAIAELRECVHAEIETKVDKHHTDCSARRGFSRLLTGLGALVCAIVGGIVHAVARNQLGK